MDTKSVDSFQDNMESAKECEKAVWRRDTRQGCPNGLDDVEGTWLLLKRRCPSKVYPPRSGHRY